MAKTIQFTYKDTDYTLEYTRKTLEKMESDGIVLAEMNKKLIIILPKLFEYVFYAHHRRIKRQRQKIYFNYLQIKIICILNYQKWQWIH